MPTDLMAWKQALAEGNPIVFGLRLYKSFDRHRTKGLVPQPTPSETSRASHSGHAMLAVGYSDVDRVARLVPFRPLPDPHATGKPSCRPR